MKCPYCNKQLYSIQYPYPKPLPNDSFTPVRPIKRLKTIYIQPYCRNCNWSSQRIYDLEGTTFMCDFINPNGLSTLVDNANNNYKVTRRKVKHIINKYK